MYLPVERARERAFTNRARLLAVSITLATCSSCASIIKGSSETVAFTSEPAGARVSVIEAGGELVAEAVTPCELELDRGKGYFSARSYDVRFEKPGFAPLDAELSGSVNGWYLGGNLIFGGLLGYLVIDPLTGAMFTLSRGPVHAELVGAATP